MHPHHGQARRYRHALCAWFIIAFASGGNGRDWVGQRGHRPTSSRLGSLLPLVGGLGMWTIGNGWGLGVEAKPVNVTVGPRDASVELSPPGGWTLERFDEAGSAFEYAIGTTEEARALFQFEAIDGTSLYYTSPLFGSNSAVSLILDGVTAPLNTTRSASTSQGATMTFLFAQDMRAGRHTVALRAMSVDGRAIGNASFGLFSYTIDDLSSDASPPSTALESSPQPTGNPLSDTTNNVNADADASPKPSNNSKLVIPLAVIGALLGVLVIGIFILWIFKFPHYCCGPARKVIDKVVKKSKPSGNEKSMIDLTDGEAGNRASSTTEEGYASGKMLPPIPAATSTGKPKMRFKVPEIPGLAAFSTKVKSVRLSNLKPATALRSGSKSKDERPFQAEDPIDRHFELMTSGSPHVPAHVLRSAPYPTANNASGGSFDPRTLLASNSAPAMSNSDLSYVTAPPGSYPPQAAVAASSTQTSPLSPLRPSTADKGKGTAAGNPYLLNSNPKVASPTSAAKQASAAAAARGTGEQLRNANNGSTSPTVTVRQLAMDLPYLQYLDALTVPAARISHLVSRGNSSSGSHKGGSQRGGHQRNGGGSKLVSVPDDNEGALRNVAPLSNKHLAALNEEVQKEKERAESTRKRGTEESSSTPTQRPEPNRKEELLREPEPQVKAKAATSAMGKFGLGKSKTKNQDTSSPKATLPSPESSTQPSPSLSPAAQIGDGAGLGGGVDEEGPIGTNMTNVSMGTSLTGMTIAATGAPTAAGTRSARASSSAATVVGGTGDASPHPKKTSFWGALTGSGAQNTIPLPPTPAPDSGGRTTPSFGDSMVVVTQPRSRTTSASGGAMAPPSSMWKMAVPQRKRRDSSVEREKREKMGPREGRGAQKEKDANVVTPPAHASKQESISSSGHGEPAKIRPLPPVTPLQLAPKPMRELPKPVLAPSPPPPASQPRPSVEQEVTLSRPAASPEPASPPSHPMGARERSKPVRPSGPQARPSAELQQQLNDVLASPTSSPAPQPPKTQAQRVQVQPGLSRADSASSEGHAAGGSRRPLPLPPPAGTPVPAPSPSPPVAGGTFSQQQQSPPLSQPQPQPPSLPRQESERRANPPPPRPPPRPSLPPSAVSAPVLASLSRRVPVPAEDAAPVASSAALFQPLPSVVPSGSGDFTNDWSDMTFGMGQSRVGASTYQQPTPPAPKPSLPSPPPRPPPPPTVYSYDDEDGEDSIYADQEATWPPAPPPSMASVPPTPHGVVAEPRTAAEGNVSYPEHPRPVTSKLSGGGSKAKTRVKPKGPAGSKSHGGSGGGSGSFGQKKEAYDPVWRPDAAPGGSRR